MAALSSVNIAGRDSERMYPFAVALFACSLLFIVYTYFVYPILIAIAARLRPRPIARQGNLQPTISIVVAAHNEAANLPGRVANLLAQNYPSELFDIILVSDGSTDSTTDVIDELARQHVPRIKALPLAENGGKAVALNAGIEIASGEIVVFADARQRFAPDVLARLAENFADPDLGSVSGELMFTAGDPDHAAASSTASAERRDGVAAQVGVYWKYEKWIRRNESAFSSMLGATGAIYAIRRALYTPLPAGTLLDDFLTPIRIVLQGKRAVFDSRALAWDRPSERGGQEFKRKVRTLAGNYQAFAFEPALVSPFEGCSIWWQVISHKLFRLIVPFALALLLLLNCLLLACVAASPGPAHRHLILWLVVAAAQFSFYFAAFWGWRWELAGRPMPGRLVSLAYTFTALNLAAAQGLFVWLRAGDGRGVWQKAYTPEQSPRP